MNIPSKNKLKQMNKDELLDAIYRIHDELKKIAKKGSTFEKRIETFKQINPHIVQQYKKFDANEKLLNDKLAEAKNLLQKCNIIGTHLSNIEKNKNQLQETFTDAKRKRTHINNFMNTALNGPDSTKAKLKKLHEELEKDIKKTTDNLKKVDNTLTTIKTYESDIEVLKKRIQDLLPGATSATLAFAFREAKKRYGAENIPKDDKQNDEKDKLVIQQLYNVLVHLWNNGDKVGIILYIVFITILIIIAQLSLGLVNNNQSTDLVSLLSRIIPLFPLTWIAIHLNRVINLRRKLFEEYNYKERLMILLTGLNEEKKQDEKFYIENTTLTKIIEQSIEKPSYITTKSRDDIPLFSLFGLFLGKKSKNNQDDE